MGLALAEARAAAEHQDVPVGCVVVGPGAEVLAREHNRREQLHDPTAHAEILALRAAARDRGHWRLDDCTLYVTLEPCTMCAGAMVNARLGQLVYGAADPKAGAVVSVHRVSDLAALNHHYPYRGGLRETECADLLRQFFRRLRAEGQK